MTYESSELYPVYKAAIWAASFAHLEGVWKTFEKEKTEIMVPVDRIEEDYERALSWDGEEINRKLRREVKKKKRLKKTDRILYKTDS